MIIAKNYYHPGVEILTCNYTGIDRHWTFNGVENKDWRFYWNNSPGAYLIRNGEETAMLPACYYLISPGTRFSTRAEKSCFHLWIHFSAGIPFNRISPGIYPVVPDRNIKDKISSLSKYLLKNDNLEVSMRLLLYSLIFDSLSNFHQKDFESFKSLDSRIEMAMDILNKNTSSVIGNDELAEKVHMATNGFIRLFTNETGVSPQKYSRRRRIEKAAKMLHLSDMKIEDIAKDCGFIDRYHFSRVFKQVLNHSPAMFREENK